MNETFEQARFLAGGGEYAAILALVFLAAVSVAGAVVYLFSRGDVLSQRLNRLLAAPQTLFKGRPRLVTEEPTGLVAKVVKPLHRLAVPSEDAVKKKLRLRLVQGGFRSNQAYLNFLAAKTAGAILFPLAWLFRGVFVSLDSKTLVIAVILSAVGYFLPDLFVLHFRQKRQERIFKAVPDALDMMVVCVESGLGLDMTFKRVGEEIRSLSPDLSDEFLLTNLEVRAGKPRDEALRNMSSRTGVPEVQNLSTILIQTARFGTSLAKALRVHADGMRTKRRQVAEERAAKTTIKLIFPLIFFIFPALFVILDGPAAIRIARNLLPALGGLQ
jgi:tight adherence protein C